MDATFKRGTVFRHGRWMEPGSREKALCRVTAIRNGVVYYGIGADATKGDFYASPERLISNGAVIVGS